MYRLSLLYQSVCDISSSCFTWSYYLNNLMEGKGRVNKVYPPFLLIIIILYCLFPSSLSLSPYSITCPLLSP